MILAKTNSNLNLSKKKILGLIGLIVFSLVFIFACLSSFLPVGKAIVGTFGIMTYPLFFVLAFLSLASFLGFSYKRANKPTTLFILSVVFVLFVIHSISTFKTLDAVVSFSKIKTYLAVSYQKTTLLGSFGSIFTGLYSILLGAMGTIILFVILSTIFIGLFFDYQFYGKFEEPRVKKLKNKALREKVDSSDADRNASNEPKYSFSNNNEVVDEISVDAADYQPIDLGYQAAGPSANSPVVDEITDTAESEDIAYSEPFYQQNTNDFNREEFGQKSYPSPYVNSNDEHRRNFMNATFGGAGDFYAETKLSGITDFDNDDEENDIINTPANELFNNNLNSDDEISKIFSGSEDDDDDLEFDEKQMAKNTFDRFKEQNENKDVFGFEKPSRENEPYRTQNFGVTKPESSQNFNNYMGRENDFERPTREYAEPKQPQTYSPKNNGFVYEKPQEISPSPVSPTSNNFCTNFGEIKVPAKEQKPINNYGVNIGMTGIRYNPPPLSLLQTPKPDTGDYTAEQARKTAQLENVLQAFNINAKVVNIVRGPKITRFELAVPLGTSVKKIPQYEDDIAAALAAKTITIRAPIPGSSFVGIELENDTFSTVYQRELFESEAFQNCKDPLPIAIGKDISGEIVVRSLADMTHLLIAGSTGSGKSVFIHNIVLSILYKSSPEEVKLIMIDPKRVEFNRYNGLPHLVSPEVVMGSQKAINALKWCVKEMDRRYELMSKAGYNNIKPYNKSDLVKAGQFEKFPYIVIIVDELAEIMQANKKEAEACIQRITQLARACGMHMVLATQRPSVDIITGVIKNNIPSRVAFSLQSGIDSKTIINTIGAEKLLGKGDMLFSPTGTSAMPRLQASYATDDEIQKIIDYVKHNNVAKYDESVAKAIDSEQVAPDDASAGGYSVDAVPPKNALDPYFKVALKMVMQNDGASTSYLQRRLAIGYSRAAKIIDSMADRGYISPANGSKLRKIIITPEQFEQEFGESYDSID